VNAGALFIGLRRRDVYRPESGWWLFLTRQLVALVIMAALIALITVDINWTSPELNPWIRVGWLAVALGAGFLAYIASLLILGLRPSHLRRRQST
jgi:putative peptidoglycan lipid II flippase